MKIDFIIASLTGGGAERVLILLANELRKKNNEVSIITFNGQDDYAYGSGIKRVKLHEGFFNNHTIRRFFQLNKYYLKKKNRPDIIISFLPPVSFVAILVAKFYGIKIIASEHINHLQVENKTVAFTRNYVYRLANRITVLTKFDVSFYEKKGAKVVVMPNPCTFENIIANEHARKKVILAIGHLNRYHHKGFDNLIKLISPILEENKDWSLNFVGAGDKGQNYLKSLIQGNIQNQIVFSGFSTEVKTLMKESAIFVLSSRFEGLPMVLLEAMSQGMSCIAFDCKTGPSDIITDGKNGLLIQDQNIGAMQDGLVQLIIDENLRKKLGDNAIMSLDSFSIDNIITKCQNLFEEIS